MFEPVLRHVIREFVETQKLHARIETLPDGISIIRTDDDYGLINTYVVADEVPSPESLTKVVAEEDLESNRSMLIVPDDQAGTLDSVADSLAAILNRTAVLSEFLDGHLRPRALCDRLLHP